MTPNSQYEYDVAFVIPDDDLEAFESWRPEATCQWSFDDRVRSFDEQHACGGRRTEGRFVFGFRSLTDWADFIDGAVHRENMDRLEALAETIDESLWYPSWSPPKGSDRTIIESRTK